ncbi:polysaccharide biosynthesis tyrosine autokinase [Paraburkholderia haematera]|uniref:Tyrosine-protein kinase wzc n=1 Tax=Paraburkholderia haematera TaxID=2793077 RepID=A0ABM8R9W4_9BURK|nr:polysaccharide biosynthesis tyrosine autokinase [Paraburkholderia haematera]CAE6741268.1 Tyrosine-protein kinase wzc [Paraburkholderia haematera]
MQLIQKPYRIAPAGDEEIDLSNYLSVVREKWKMIAAWTIAGACVGVAYSLLASPIYRADAMFQIEESINPAQGALNGLASIFDTKQTAASEIEVVKSRLVADQAVHNLHLDITASPHYFPVIGAAIARLNGSEELASPVPGLSKFAWGGEKIAVSTFDVPRDDYETRYTLIARENGAYDLFDADRQPVLHGTAGTLARGRFVELMVDRLVARPGTEFRLMRTSPLQATAALQNALKIDEKSKQADIIKLSLDGTDATRTADIVNSLAHAYLQQNIDRKSADAEKALEFLNHQLPDLRKELEQAETRYNDFRNRKGTANISEEERLLLQQVVDNKAKLTELQQRRLEMSQRFADTHPAVVALDSQITALQGQQELLSKNVAGLPETEQSALRLLRDVRVDTELYTSLLDSAQQLRITKAGQLGNVRLVDFAVTPETAVWPKRWIIVAITSVLGLFAGVGLSFVRRAVFGGVETASEIETALGVPVFAAVPRSFAQRRMNRRLGRNQPGDANVLALAAPDDIAVEGIRSLRTALKFGLGEASNNIIALTGPRPEAGKSFIALNLAAVLASGDKRVLLIDGDMRRGVLDTVLGMPPSQGLSDVIRGRDLHDSIVRDVLPGVDVLPRGSDEKNPSELLLRERFTKVLEECSAAYDVVIIDTPPVLAVTDPVLICKHAGVSLLVFRFGHSPIGEVTETANRLLHAGVSIKGALLTDIPQQRVKYGAGYYSHAR